MRFTGSSGSRRTEPTHANSRLHLRIALAGTLAVPAPRPSLPVTRRDPRGFEPSVDGPRELRSSPEFSFQPAPVGGCRPPLLGFVPGAASAADIAAGAVLVAPVLLRPSIDLVPGVYSRADIAAVASVSECQLRDPVPTSPFRTVSPVYSAVRPARAGLLPIAGLGFAGLLHPAADPGVRCVSR